MRGCSMQECVREEVRTLKPSLTGAEGWVEWGSPWKELLCLRGTVRSVRGGVRRQRRDEMEERRGEAILEGLTAQLRPWMVVTGWS